MAKNGIGRGDMEKHIGQRPGLEVILACECFGFIPAHGKGDLFIFLPVKTSRWHRGQPRHGLVDACDQLIERVFSIFILRWTRSI